MLATATITNSPHRGLTVLPRMWEFRPIQIFLKHLPEPKVFKGQTLQSSSWGAVFKWPSPLVWGLYSCKRIILHRFLVTSKPSLWDFWLCTKVNTPYRGYVMGCSPVRTVINVEWNQTMYKLLLCPLCPM